MKVINGAGTMEKVKLCAVVDSDTARKVGELRRHVGAKDNDELLRLALDILDESVAQAQLGRHLAFVDDDKSHYQIVTFEEVEGVRLSFAPSSQEQNCSVG